MDSETSTDSKSSRSAALTFALWAFAIVFVVYPLSLGPVLATAKAVGVKNSSGIAPFYQPVNFVYNHVPPVQAFYDWYLPLWGVR